jgi:hypothetical protein
MDATDIRIRISRLRELSKFYMLAAAAEDDLDSNVFNLAEEVRQLESMFASLVGEVERLESAFIAVEEITGIRLEFQDGSLPSPE